ncbi:MAG: hypothetical protein J3Q66DRAFT_366602 [Benniella sp.]|nr:MAG: hypothetical protein J3Q66DRAFT_366602 [Benniella sp.]
MMYLPTTTIGYTSLMVSLEPPATSYCVQGLVALRGLHCGNLGFDEKCPNGSWVNGFWAKWIFRGTAHDINRLSRPSGVALNTSITSENPHTLNSVDIPPVDHRLQRQSSITIPAHIFGKNVRLPTIKLPRTNERLCSTSQLAHCLALLKTHSSADKHLEPTVLKWLQQTEKDNDEQERLLTLATEVIKAFKRDEIKDTKADTEVVCLAPVLSRDVFRDLLSELCTGIDHSRLLDVHQLEGLAQLIQGAETGYLSSDDLVRVLELLNNRLKDTHQKSTQHMHQLTLIAPNVLDAMADTNVSDLDRETLHEPLSDYLREMMGSSDPYLVYQEAYACQALLCIRNNKTKWQAAMRRTRKVAKGVSGLITAAKVFDISKFIEGLVGIQKGFEGASNIVHKLISAYKDVSKLVESGQRLLDSLKEELSFDCKRDWYAALRAVDVLIRDGEFATFKELVWKAPCRCDPAFQWGVCQRLGEVASNPLWNPDTRGDAITFLAKMYKNDEVWEQQTSFKQWTLNILKQLSTTSGDGSQSHTAVAMMLQELGANGDVKKRELYKVCQETGITYLLKVAPAQLGVSSLLNDVQNSPDVEENIRLMRKRRTQGRSDTIYIPPQANPSLQSSDHSRFPWMRKVEEFMKSSQKVFQLLGDPVAGKSIFSRELEYDLWLPCKKKGRIPLHISLPGIDKSGHDMIAKQLRIAYFSEEHIRQMKHYLKFVLICDGCDESQEAQKLNTNGITFLKFTETIYKEQGGHLVVEYSQLVDGKSWKAELFDHEGRKPLREACPLTRNDIQHQFIHRLEYGLARAVFDPQDKRTRASSGLDVGRRWSVRSTLSIESQDHFDQMAEANEPEPDIDSPLVGFKCYVFAWRLSSCVRKRRQDGADDDGDDFFISGGNGSVLKWKVTQKQGGTSSTSKKSRKAAKNTSTITGTSACQDAKPTKELLESQDTRQSFEEWGDSSSNDASVEAPAEFNQAQDPQSPPPDTGGDDDGKRRDTVTETSRMIF